MGFCNRVFLAILVCTFLALGAVTFAPAEDMWRLILPEQRQMQIRDPSMLPKARLPDLPSPPTVTDPQADAPVQHLSLDDAIHTALANSEVIRVLAGVTAASSGRTIYDPAITNTQIDQARGRFDPSIQVQNNFTRTQIPQGVADPGHPSGARLVGDPTHDYDMTMDLSKTTMTGGTANFGVNAHPSHTRTSGLLLNPQSRSTLDLSYTQPLLKGAGTRVNAAAIVIARIDTERSFFRMKDSVQQLVLGVIEGYWGLVFARTDVWARQQQVQQGEEAFRRADARLRKGLGDSGDVALARSSLASFRASLITAKASVLQREAALRNILGLPPTQSVRIVPVSPPTTAQQTIDWDHIVNLAEVYRPDLIELKLILEADRQERLLARNQALPNIDAAALYRWNGLEGRTPNRTLISTGPGDFTGWQLGVNFSVPLGLRQSRAALRQTELLIMRDRANLHQGLHNATHTLAANYRNLTQFYEQYRAFGEARAAAQYNLDFQFKRYREGFAIFLNVLQGITSWGNSVSSESQALIQYNIELAGLERQTGTILETHGVRFVEERFGSIGPLGRVFDDRCYPKDRRPTSNAPRYESTSEPAENVFHLDDPLPPRRGASGGMPPGAGGERLQLVVPEQIPLPAPRR